ncbi:MAG: nitrogen regulation protein NR(II) [Thermodesulfobacteriota bacterium]
MSLSENILDSLSEGLIAMDSALRVTAFNQGAEKITALPRSLAVGKSISHVIEKDGWVTELAGKSMREEKAFSEYDGEIHQRLGPPLPVSATVSPLFNDTGKVDGVVLLLREIAGTRLLETDSTRRERLALIGAFAAGIAHEIKNPLGGIKGAAQLLARKLSDQELKEYTDVITREADRLSAILDDILNFASPRKPRPEQLNIHQVLDYAREMVPLPKGRSLLIEYDPSIPPVTGDREQLVQVFINIIKNGVESLSDGGTVRIITRTVTDFHLAEPGVRGRSMASVTVKDNGCGIAPENLDKLFTPFFTTKKEGTGLGIAIAFRIVKEHGGLFTVESSHGDGTELSVYLPVSLPTG